jgi:hypothetical protein
MVRHFYLEREKSRREEIVDIHVDDARIL